MNPMNGYKAALIALLSFITGLYGIIITAQNATPSGGVIFFGVLFILLAVLLIKGLMVVNYKWLLSFSIWLYFFHPHN